MPQPQPNPDRNQNDAVRERLIEFGYVSIPEGHQRIVAQLPSSIGGPNLTIENLEDFLMACPQFIGGKPRYLVSGGFAVDITTSQARTHKESISCSSPKKKLAHSGAGVAWMRFNQRRISVI